MRHLALAALVASTLAAGCTIDSAVAGGFRLSPKLTDACLDSCRVLNLRLAAVVVVGNSGGCVCEPPDRPAAAAHGGAAAAGGAVVQLGERQAAGAAAAGTAHH